MQIQRPAKFQRLDNGGGCGFGFAGDKGAGYGGEKGVGKGGEKGAPAMAVGGKGGCGQDSQEIAFKVLASQHAAGKIIGRGGTEIAALRKQCGIACRISEGHFPNTGCQVVCITGPREGIDLAFGFLISKLAEADSPVGPGGQVVTVMAVLTSNTISAVIGTKGSTIAQLRGESGCNFSADKEKFNGEQVLRITGAMENIPYALAMVSPLVERSGDSMLFAKHEYGKGGGPGEPAAFGGGFSPKGAGKRKGGFDGAPQWAPAAIGKGGCGGGFGGGAPVGKGLGGGIKLRPLNPVPTLAPQFGGHAETLEAFEGSAATLDQDAHATEEMFNLFGPLEDEFEDPASAAGGFEVGLGALGGDDAGFGGDEQDPAVLGSMTTINFSIPKETIGRVLGKGGASSAEIRRQTGVTLKILPTETEGIVTLSGTVAGVHQAHLMIVSRVLASY